MGGEREKTGKQVNLEDRDASTRCREEDKLLRHELLDVHVETFDGILPPTFAGNEKYPTRKDTMGGESLD